MTKVQQIKQAIAHKYVVDADNVTVERKNRNTHTAEQMPHGEGWYVSFHETNRYGITNTRVFYFNTVQSAIEHCR